MPNNIQDSAQSSKETTLSLSGGNENTLIGQQTATNRPLILITDSHNSPNSQATNKNNHRQQTISSNSEINNSKLEEEEEDFTESEKEEEEEQVEEIDGIKYRIVAAVTKPLNSTNANPQKHRQRSKTPNSIIQNSQQQQQNNNNNNKNPVILEQENERDSLEEQQQNSYPINNNINKSSASGSEVVNKRFLSSVRRKSSAFVSSLLTNSFLGPQSASSHEIGAGGIVLVKPRRMSIYEMTKSPPPETSLEMYLSERRRSSTISSKQVQQQLEQQSTFETNYCQRQQYFKDLNQKLINHDKKLLNVVANRGQIHRHSVDIAQLPLHLAQAKAKSSKQAKVQAQAQATSMLNSAIGADNKNAPPSSSNANNKRQQINSTAGSRSQVLGINSQLGVTTSSQQSRSKCKSKSKSNNDKPATNNNANSNSAINQLQFNESNSDDGNTDEEQEVGQTSRRLQPLAPAHKSLLADMKRGSGSSSRGDRYAEKSRIVIRKFQKLDESQLSSTPAPDVKIGQRVAYKEYYGNEFGTIRWIGRVPQICPDWTAGVEFDNAIGEGDGSLNGRRYFIAKDCFAKFLPLSEVAFVDQHVGRPEPGTMISVMSAAARPGQMISIQRVSTVHVQHCFLNAPHQIPGADILAVNTRLHCQCPNCGPCAHVIKPPRTQRLARSKKNATHMCQFSTYTCCGMESQEEAMCAYTGNKATSSLPPPASYNTMPPIGNSWIEGAGYLTNLQAQQTKSIPEEYKMGAVPEDQNHRRGHGSRSSSQRGSGKHNHNHHHHHHSSRQKTNSESANQSNQQQQPPTPAYSETPSVDWQAPNASGLEKVMGSDASEKHELIGDNLNQSFFPDNNMQNPPSYSPNPDYVNFSQPFSQATATTTATTTSNPIIVCPKKNVPYEEPVWCEPPKTVSTTPKGGAAAKVVYRDSIENRYLFPTDDPIDSTLEADLENLSQARYGHSANSRLNGSKNIFKSLRSLVSCLSAQSNHSEIMERRSENTMKFSDYGDRGISKAMPEIINTIKPTNDLIVQQSNSHKQQNNIINSLNDDECLVNGSMPNHHHHHHHKMPPYDHQKTIMRHISSSSDCGFSSASQNSINCQSHNQTFISPQISVEERRKRNQIYNNFLSHLMSSTSMNEEDLIRLRRVLFEPHLDNCCLHNNFNQVSLGAFSDDAEQIIANSLNDSYAFHENKGIEQMQRASSACYHNVNHFSTQNKRDHLENNSKKINKFPQRSLNDGSITSESATISSYDSFCGTAVVGGDNQSNSSITEGGKLKENKSEKSTTNSTLPKAFELKLTLSINNAEKTREQGLITESANTTSETTDVSNSVEETIGNLLNSTFNINIVSNQSEESTDKKLVIEKGSECQVTGTSIQEAN